MPIYVVCHLSIINYHIRSIRRKNLPPEDDQNLWPKHAEAVDNEYKYFAKSWY
jgi:hypothetical protein